MRQMCGYFLKFVLELCGFPKRARLLTYFNFYTLKSKRENFKIMRNYAENARLCGNMRKITKCAENNKLLKTVNCAIPHPSHLIGASEYCYQKRDFKIITWGSPNSSPSISGHVFEGSGRSSEFRNIWPSKYFRVQTIQKDKFLVSGSSKCNDSDTCSASQQEKLQLPVILPSKSMGRGK